MLQATHTEPTVCYCTPGYQTGVRDPLPQRAEWWSTCDRCSAGACEDSKVSELWRISLYSRCVSVWWLRRRSFGFAVVPSTWEPGSCGRSQSGAKGERTVFEIWFGATSCWLQYNLKQCGRKRYGKEPFLCPLVSCFRNLSNKHPTVLIQSAS